MKARFFEKLCEDMEAEHSSLLYYTSALSHDNILSYVRTFKLGQEMFIFLEEQGHKYAEDFADADFF